MRPSIFILALLSLNACLQDKSPAVSAQQSTSTGMPYVMNPDPDDSLCREEIQRAKNDLRDGKIVFTQQVGLGFGSIRYEDELKDVCQTYGLAFDFDLFSCIVFEGQTQGCYGDYMDEMIKDKFGPGFKDQLHAKADSIFLVAAKSGNKVVASWDCDEQPRLPGENKKPYDFKVPAGIDIAGGDAQSLFFDLGFIVEKDSTISNFYVDNFVAEVKENEKLKDKLFPVAVKFIRSGYPTWVPGKINGVPVRTDNSVRVYLTR